jgi:micrococcal nuclease
VRGTWLLAFVVGTTSACATSPTASPDRPLTGPGFVVTRVVDGDTLDIAVDGAPDQRVRLIGIDTPESVIPGEAPECFGPEASTRLGALTPPGTRVRLERDVEARDPYGRLLAYVYVADDMVNLALAREGYAEALVIPPNTAWASEFRAAAAQARSLGVGLWAVCPR